MLSKRCPARRHGANGPLPRRRRVKGFTAAEARHRCRSLHRPGEAEVSCNVRALALVCGVFLGSVPAAAAGLPPRSPDWQRYVPAPRSNEVPPVRVVSTAGPVENARALVGGGGVTT